MADKEAAGRFLRTLLGLYTVASVIVVVVFPINILVILLLLVSLWVFATVLAAFLAYGSGYDYLRESSLYNPGIKTSSATAVFALLAVALKLVLTFLANSILGEAAVYHIEGIALGVLALVVAYVLVFVAGAVAWFR